MKGRFIMRDLQRLREHLIPGKVYRRAELVKFSKSVDRHLRQLVDVGALKKLWTGVYYCPENCSLGELPPEMNEVVRAFLKTDDFYITDLSFYNGLSLGTTQLYNENLVYNNKRRGRMKLSRQNYYFLKGRKFPQKTTMEFMLVDMVNNLNLLAEDCVRVRNNIARRAVEMGKDKILSTANNYGKASTKKFFERVFENEAVSSLN